MGLRRFLETELGPRQEYRKGDRCTKNTNAIQRKTFGQVHEKKVPVCGGGPPEREARL